MAGGITDKTVKGLAPQSWTSVAVWAVLVVIFISAPVQTAKLTVSVVGGTGRWIAYTAFAECGTEPPLEWMTAKECDGAPVVPVEPVNAEPSVVAGGSVYGVQLPTPDRTWQQLERLKSGAVGQVDQAMNRGESQ